MHTQKWLQAKTMAMATRRLASFNAGQSTMYRRMMALERSELGQSTPKEVLIKAMIRTPL